MKANIYSEKHKVYNTRVIAFLVELTIVRMLFNILKSNMGLRLRDGLKCVNMLYHYFLVLLRAFILISFMTYRYTDFIWIVDQTCYRMFAENNFHFRKDMDEFKRPISSYINPASNTTQMVICYSLWLFLFLFCALFSFIFIITVCYCCSFSLCFSGRSLGYGLTLLYTFFIEVLIGTKSWRKAIGEDEDGDDGEDNDNDYYTFKRTRNLRPPEIQAIEDQMKDNESENYKRRQHDTGVF